MTSSVFGRLLKDNLSTETKRNNFIEKLRLRQSQAQAPSQARSVLITKLRLAVEIDDVKEYFRQHDFGEVDKITFHHTKRNDYTKSVIVRMKTCEAAERIWSQKTHKILGDIVCAEPLSGSTQLKGRYKLILKGLNTNMSDVELNEQIEEAFAHLGHHTAIDLWKDTKTQKLEGTAEIRFVNKEDGLEAVEIAIEEFGWSAQLFGPREA